MPRNRFLELQSFLRFDDAVTRRANPPNNLKLDPISQLFNPVNQSFREFFEPGLYLTIDEMLVKFRWKLPIPSLHEE
jgi:hypothetical protein